MTELRFTFTLNGAQREVRVPAHQTLLRLLRDDLGAVEVKEGCGEGAASPDYAGFGETDMPRPAMQARLAQNDGILEAKAS